MRHVIIISQHKLHANYKRPALAMIFDINKGVRIGAASDVALPVNDVWYLYLIECVGGSFYSGISNNVEKRFKNHLAGKGAKYTRANPPVRLIGTCAYASRSLASKAEYQIKRLPKSKKISFLRDASALPAII